MKETIDLRIDKIVHGGDGLGRHDGMAVFVSGAAPGDLLRVSIVEKHKRHARGRIEAILEPSPQRRHPPCRYYPDCGGCQLQHLDYGAQVQAKAKIVEESLARLGGIRTSVDVIADPVHEWGYRTRVTAHLRGGRFGFFAERSHRVVDVESCPLLVPELDAAWRAARRELEYDGEIEIVAGDTGAESRSSWRGRPAGRAGPSGQVRTTVGEVVYRHGVDAFFQCNRYLVGRLVDEATRGPASAGLAVELYSGVGLFTAPLSARFGRTVAVESHPAAIEYARRNTDPRRVELVAADAAAWLAATTLKPEFVLVDPPREGLGIEASLALARLEAAELAYVSCDPATLARDVKALSGEGYTVASAVVVDMFPQTFHVEAVIRLRRAASTREK